MTRGRSSRPSEEKGNERCAHGIGPQTGDAAILVEELEPLGPGYAYPR